VRKFDAFSFTPTDDHLAGQTDVAITAEEYEGVAADEAAHETDHQRRHDIQGLRALAVLMVVAFHAGLPLPGGFVGVDVFFVISGFVITATLHREFTTTGRIRFGTFYLRRFKRLTPALALMVTAVVLFSTLALSPLGPLHVAAQTAVGASLLCANIVIARTTGGYFDPPADTNPLLNTWSLSVEEQFYLVFPLVITGGWLLARGSSRYRVAPIFLVGVVALVSFGLAVLDSSTPIGPGELVGFYSPLTRAWEFASGALLALSTTAHFISITSRRSSLILGLIGVVALAASLWLISGTTPFPGVWTLLPVTGTMLLIAVGTARPDGAVTRVLSTGPLVRIGDWSYSLYLWHWPFIVFAGLLWPDEPWVLPAAGLAASVPALASYYWVEQPLRRLTQRDRRRLTTLVATTIAVPLLVAGFAPGVVTHWSPVSAFEGHDAFYSYIDSRWFRCPQDVERLVNEKDPQGKKRCFRSQQSDRYDVVLFGDSHAEHFFPGLAMARPHDNILVLIDGSPPFVGNDRFAPMIEFIRDDPNIRTVIYAAFWERRLPPGDADLNRVFDDTLSDLHAPGRTLILMEDVPAFSFDVTDCVGNTILRVKRCSEASMSRLDYMRFFRTLSARDPSIRVVPIRELFCQRTTCRMDPAGTVLYRDSNHLNVAGSMLVAPSIVSMFQK